MRYSYYIASLLLLCGEDIVSIMSQSLISIMYDEDDGCILHGDDDAGCIMHDMWYDYSSIHDDDGCYRGGIEMHDDDDDRYKLLNSTESR